MEFLNEYMVAIVVGICVCVGYILKNLIPNDAINRFIPLIMGVLGAAINLWINDFSFTPAVLLGGIVSGLASTGLHQVFKQFISKNNVENKD